MPRHFSRSYWARSNAVPSMPKFDRLVIVGLLVVGGIVTFANDGYSGSGSSANVSTLPLSGTTFRAQPPCAGDIAVAGGCVRIAMTAFAPKTQGVYQFDDEQTQPPVLRLNADNRPASEH